MAESFQLAFEGEQCDCKSARLVAAQLTQKAVVTLRDVRTSCVQGD